MPVMEAMTDAALIDRLAKHVFNWGVTADRFLLPNRSWCPRWKFRPLEKLSDAFKLLDAAAPTRYAISFSSGRFRVEVEVKGNVGRANRTDRPRTIVLALARSLKLTGAKT